MRASRSPAVRNPSEPGVLARLLSLMRRVSRFDDPRQGQLFVAEAPATQPMPSTPATPSAASTPPDIEQGRPRERARAPHDDATTPAPELFAPHGFAHPRAERRTVLQGHVVAYAFARVRRRSIGMAVGPEGLSVRAPRWVSVGEVEAALQERAGWIVRHLRDQQARAERERASRIDWRDGASVPFLGEPLVVVLDERVTGAVLDAGETDASAQASLGTVPRRMLRVGLRHDAAPDAIRDTVHAWLQRQARRIFDERTRHFAAVLGVTVTRLSLSAARTRWGSASADGSVRLNWRLVHHDMACIDYVVVHELAHLRHMNHGPDFWRVVKAALPAYERAKVRLHESDHDVRD